MKNQTAPYTLARDFFRDLRSGYTAPAALNSPNWAIITATREAVGDVNHPQNLSANASLRAIIAHRGLAFEECRGIYKGLDQGVSFLVWGISPAVALDLAEFFGQESVLTCDGLLFTDGTAVPRNADGEFWGSAASLQPFYTQLPSGVCFCFGLDFSKRAEIPKHAVATVCDEVPVRLYVWQGIRRLDIDVPNGWEDVAQICRRLLDCGGRKYKFSGWNSDRNVAFFSEVSGASVKVPATFAK